MSKNSFDKSNMLDDFDARAGKIVIAQKNRSRENLAFNEILEI